MATINLFGASGHARVIADIISAGGDTPGVFYDDSPRCSDIGGRPVLRASECEVSGPMVIAIGSNRVRQALSERYRVPYATAVHPSALISPSATVGEGTVVMHGAIIQAEAVVGRHCIINTGASVDHECRLGDYVHISPHATLCGNVQVGEGSWIGAGATVIPGIKIGRWCVVGAGSTVITDVPDGATVVGVVKP